MGPDGNILNDWAAAIALGMTGGGKGEKKHDDEENDSGNKDGEESSKSAFSPEQQQIKPFFEIGFYLMLPKD